MSRTKYSLYLEDEQLALLEADSQRTGAPVSELIRRAIDAMYGRVRKPKVRAEEAKHNDA